MRHARKSIYTHIEALLAKDLRVITWEEEEEAAEGQAVGGKRKARGGVGGSGDGGDQKT
jgi:hypothetical protein